MTLESFLKHTKNDVSYPATKKQLVEACNNMSDVPAVDREYFQKKLPDGKYNKPEEVLNALLAKV